MLPRPTQAQATIRQTVTADPLSDPVALALDPNGNLLIADKGAGVVYKLPTSGITSGLPPTVAATGISAPVAVASDAAGSIYIADSSSKQVVSITPTGQQIVIFSGLTSPNGLAVQGLGDIVISDSAATGIIEVGRQSFAFDFGTNTALTLKGTVSNAGDATASGLGVSSSDFNINGSGATCPTDGSSILPGESCVIVASFAPVPDSLGARPVTGTVSFIPPTFGNITLTGTKSGATIPTTTVLSNQAPAAPLYVGSGTTVSFDLAVTATSGVPQGNVRVQLEDIGLSTVYPLNSSGTARVTFSGVPSAAIRFSPSIRETIPISPAPEGPSSLSLQPASRSLPPIRHRSMALPCLPLLLSTPVWLPEIRPEPPLSARPPLPPLPQFRSTLEAIPSSSLQVRGAHCSLQITT